jgi:hypothetical protein
MIQENVLYEHDDIQFYYWFYKDGDSYSSFEWGHNDPMDKEWEYSQGDYNYQDINGAGNEDLGNYVFCRSGDGWPIERHISECEYLDSDAFRHGIIGLFTEFR